MTHTPNCPGGPCDDPETTFLCDVCGEERAACCGVSESETCDDCEGEKMEKRDVSFDVGINIKNCGEDEEWTIGDVEPWDICVRSKPDCDEFVRYVPFKQYDELNTTANDLRAKLEEANATALRIAHESVAKNERIVELENTIAYLRQRDTVRPEVDLAAVWDEGYDAFDSNEAEGTSVGNPYRSDPNAEPILCSKGQLALALIGEFGGIDGDHHREWVIDQVVRRLTGSGYEHWVSAMNDGEDGPNTYEWGVGIAP